jgi:hypothetical protein
MRVRTLALRVRTLALRVRTRALRVRTRALWVRTRALRVRTRALRVRTRALRVHTLALRVRTRALRVRTRVIRIVRSTIPIIRRTLPIGWRTVPFSHRTNAEFWNSLGYKRLFQNLIWAHFLLRKKPGVPGLRAVSAPAPTFGRKRPNVGAAPHPSRSKSATPLGAICDPLRSCGVRRWRPPLVPKYPKGWHLLRGEHNSNDRHISH